MGQKSEADPTKKGNQVYRKEMLCPKERKVRKKVKNGKVIRLIRALRPRSHPRKRRPQPHPLKLNLGIRL